MAKNVTIQDISRESGVSPSTVSRVLTGNAPVTHGKREAVEQAIKNLNYRPSHVARSLKTQTTFSVGLLLNGITNPFYSAVACGVEKEANRHGYSLILCNNNENTDRELQYLQVLQDKQVDGIILGPTGQNTDYIRTLAKTTPLVQVDRQVDGADIAAVVVDNQEGGYKATRLLIDSGHRRIAILKWKTNIATMVQRYAGYERALLKSGIPVDPSLIIDASGYTSELASAAVSQYFANNPNPTAIVAANNQLGLGVLDAIRKAGLRIPDDIALVVFDDLTTFSLFTPPISVVKQPATAIGERAMQLLMKQMKAPNEFEPEIVVLPTELIVRESV